MQKYHSSTMASPMYMLTIFVMISPVFSSSSVIELPGRRDGAHYSAEVSSYCESWRFAAETASAHPWRLVDPSCLAYVLSYISRGQYDSDYRVVANYAAAFAATVKLSGDGKDAWIFDIDDTLLSSIGYFEANGYGNWEPVDKKSYMEWIEKGTMPALREGLRLYNEIKKRGFTIFIVTGRLQKYRNVTVRNLLDAGYDGWERIIMRGPEVPENSGTTYKSGKRMELVREGYKIHGNVGDQWYDLNGFALAQRSFKVPNPIYGPDRLR